MKIAYFDIFSGISGDMTLGAFVDLGVPPEWIEAQIKKIPLSGFRLKCRRQKRSGISASDVLVEVDTDVPARDYTGIRDLIGSAPLPEAVKVKSLDAFERIAAAEAQIHSRDIAHVHFHEVGGVDAVVDIVGTFLCAAYLEIEKVYASTVPLGSGFVKCAHGTLPVPAPATLAILKDIPVTSHEAGFEIVTPTGAAILTTLVSAFGKMPDMAIDRVGYGCGKRETNCGIPNLLRIITGTPSGPASRYPGTVMEDQVFVLQCTVDDMSHEVAGYLMERLFKEGALDVFHIPVQMKKNRPGLKIEVICRIDAFDPVSRIIFEESTTTGIRYWKTDRVKLKREKVLKQTGFGEVPMKKITHPDGSSSIRPEFDACRKIAAEKGLPLNKVYRQLDLDINRP